MKVSLRVILGVSFLIGALLFFYRGENHYALIFLLVGALYLYKGLSCLVIIPSQHDDFLAHLMKNCHHICTVCFNLIGYTEESD